MRLAPSFHCWVWTAVGGWHAVQGALEAENPPSPPSGAHGSAPAALVSLAGRTVSRSSLEKSLSRLAASAEDGSASPAEFAALALFNRLKAPADAAVRKTSCDSLPPFLSAGGRPAACPEGLAAALAFRTLGCSSAALSDWSLSTANTPPPPESRFVSLAWPFEIAALLDRRDAAEVFARAAAERLATLLRDSGGETANPDAAGYYWTALAAAHALCAGGDAGAAGAAVGAGGCDLSLNPLTRRLLEQEGKALMRAVYFLERDLDRYTAGAALAEIAANVAPSAAAPVPVSWRQLLAHLANQVADRVELEADTAPPGDLAAALWLLHQLSPPLDSSRTTVGRAPFVLAVDVRAADAAAGGAAGEAVAKFSLHACHLLPHPADERLRVAASGMVAHIAAVGGGGSPVPGPVPLARADGSASPATDSCAPPVHFRGPAEAFDRVQHFAFSLAEEPGHREEGGAPATYISVFEGSPRIVLKEAFVTVPGGGVQGSPSRLPLFPGARTVVDFGEDKVREGARLLLAAQLEPLSRATLGVGPREIVVTSLRRRRSGPAPMFFGALISTAAAASRRNAPTTMVELQYDAAEDAFAPAAPIRLAHVLRQLRVTEDVAELRVDLFITERREPFSPRRRSRALQTVVGGGAGDGGDGGAGDAAAPAQLTVLHASRAFNSVVAVAQVEAGTARYDRRRGSPREAFWSGREELAHVLPVEFERPSAVAKCLHLFVAAGVAVFAAAMLVKMLQRAGGGRRLSSPATGEGGSAGRFDTQAQAQLRAKEMPTGEAVRATAGGAKHEKGETAPSGHGVVSEQLPAAGAPPLISAAVAAAYGALCACPVLYFFFGRIERFLLPVLVLGPLLYGFVKVTEAAFVTDTPTSDREDKGGEKAE